MRYLLATLFISLFLFGGEYKIKYWPNKMTFSQYLREYNIDPTRLYSSINKEDIKYLSTIEGGALFFEKVENKELKEALIPLGEEMQIHLYKKGNFYTLDIVPIDYKIIRDKVALNIQNSCYADLKDKTNNGNLATHLKKIFKGYIDFTKLKKDDKVVLSYEQKSIDNFSWGEPKILAAYIKNQDREYFAILKDDEYKIYTNEATKTYNLTKSKTKYKYFSQPLKKLRVTSKFTYKRWHPVLHRYRPHLGIDFGAPKGTPIYALSDGKVIFAGWMRGYGKVTKIAHGKGLVSLYAHQSSILVKNGERVKRGQIIGRVGSTGISTGPHLHLGFYKRGKPINPAFYINKKIKVQDAIVYKKVIKIVKNIENNLPLKEKRVYNLLKNFSDNNKNSPFVWREYKENKKITIKVKDVRKDKLSNSKGDTRFSFK